LNRQIFSQVLKQVGTSTLTEWCPVYGLCAMSTCMHGSTGGCTIVKLLTVTGSWNNIHSSNTIITLLPFIGRLVLVLHSCLMIIFLITWILQIFITHQVRKASTHSKSAMGTKCAARLYVPK